MHSEQDPAYRASQNCIVTSIVLTRNINGQGLHPRIHSKNERESIFSSFLHLRRLELNYLYPGMAEKGRRHFVIEFVKTLRPLLLRKGFSLRIIIDGNLMPWETLVEVSFKPYIL